MHTCHQEQFSRPLGIGSVSCDHKIAAQINSRTLTPLWLPLENPKPRRNWSYSTYNLPLVYTVPPHVQIPLWMKLSCQTEAPKLNTAYSCAPPMAVRCIKAPTATIPIMAIARPIPPMTTVEKAEAKACMSPDKDVLCAIRCYSCGNVLFISWFLFFHPQYESMTRTNGCFVQCTAPSLSLSLFGGHGSNPSPRDAQAE